MFTIRRIAPVIRKIDCGAIGSVRLLSTPVIPRKKNALFENQDKRKVAVVSNANLIQATTGNTEPKEGNANYVPNPVGRLFQATVHKAREGRNFAINDLRKLMMECKEDGDLKYVIKLMDFYQKRSYDFSENDSYFFITLCLKFDRLDLLIQEFTVFEKRIGAWTTAGDFEKMILAAEAKGVTASMLPVMHMLIKKGVVMREPIVRKLVAAAAATCDATVYGHTLFYTTRALGETICAEMAASYPLAVAPEPVSEPEAAAEGEEAAAPVV